MYETEDVKEFEKKRNWKLIAIPLVIVAGIAITIVGYTMFGHAIVNMGVTSTTTTVKPTVEQYMITGNEIIDKDIRLSEIVNLKAGRYELRFQSNNDVVVSLRKNPNGFFICCNNDNPKPSGVYKFDVNSGANGDYLLKVEGQNPSSHVTISQELAF